MHAPDLLQTQILSSRKRSATTSNNALHLQVKKFYEICFRSVTQVEKIRKMVSKAKREHDDSIYNKSFLRKMPDGEFMFTNYKTYDQGPIL